jgi:tetratricopeptide (TPR) repeat protein
MPGAGHLVHMPAHIYQRVGRYADASAANSKAVDVDLSYLSAAKPAGFYPVYTAHNYGFLAYSAAMEGRSAVALEASKKSATQTPKEVVCSMPGLDFFWSEHLLVMVRFGKWEQILAEPKPDPKYAVLLGLWHHAHGMALASTGKPAEARADREAIVEIGAGLPADLVAGLNPGRVVLELAAKILEARIAEAEKSPDAIGLWEAAVALEDGLSYSEPSDWFYPVRHYLGAALLDAGRAKEAEKVYRDDLVRTPKNGWSLRGLAASLDAQNKKNEAAKVRKQAKAAWKDADVDPPRSAY